MKAKVETAAKAAPTPAAPIAPAIGAIVTWKTDPSLGVVVTPLGDKTAVKWTYAISGKVRTSTVLTKYLTVVKAAAPAPKAPRVRKPKAPKAPTFQEALEAGRIDQLDQTSPELTEVLADTLPVEALAAA